MSDSIKCSQNDCNADAVVKFTHLDGKEMYSCEPHWKWYQMIFCVTLDVPRPKTDTVNGYIELTDEEAEIYHKAIQTS